MTNTEALRSLVQYILRGKAMFMLYCIPYLKRIGFWKYIYLQAEGLSSNNPFFNTICWHCIPSYQHTSYHYPEIILWRKEIANIYLILFMHWIQDLKLGLLCIKRSHRVDATSICPLNQLSSYFLVFKNSLYTFLNWYILALFNLKELIMLFYENSWTI